MGNEGGDFPFGVDIPGIKQFAFTDRVMAFDVTLPLSPNSAGISCPEASSWTGPAVQNLGDVDNFRRVGLFEGKDSYGRLQPLLAGETGVNTVETKAWFEPTTENPRIDDVEEWDIYNFSGDAHPIHLHLVHFQVVGRYDIQYHDGLDSAGVPHSCNNLNGVCLETKESLSHDGAIGVGFKAIFPATGNTKAYSNGLPLDPRPEYSSEAGGQSRKDLVTALPGQVTKIKVKFDRKGEYVWHCHILSHEDHEMMRKFEVI